MKIELHKIRYFITIVLLLCNVFFVKSQEREKIDSLFFEFKNSKSDTNSINLIVSLSENFQHINLDSSMIFAKQALKYSQKSNYLKGLANSNHCIGMVYVYKGEYDSCLKYWNKCLEMRIKLKDEKGISRTYNNIGVVYKNTGKFELAILNFQKALKIFEKRKDKLNISNCLSNMGNIQSDLNNYNKAIEYYLNSLTIKKELGDEKDIASCYLNIGSSFKDKGNIEKAFEYYKYSLKIFEKIGDKRGASSCYATLGTYYEIKQNYNLAIKYYQKALTIKEKLEDKYGSSLLYSNLSNLYINLVASTSMSQQQQQAYYNKKSVEYAQNALILAKESGSPPRVHSAYKNLYKGWGKLENFKKAFEYAYLFIDLNDSLLNADKTKILEEMEAKYQTEKKDQKIALQKKDKEIQDEEIKRQKILIIASIAFSTTILIFLISLVRLFIQKKKAFKLLAIQNEEILQKNEEINTQKEEIESQRDFVIKQKEENDIIHKELTDSINYAKYIQKAVLPSTKKLENINDYFVFFKPKDIVSGDFYWIKKINDWSIFAVVDCTGHGVPGAFMSMLGISFLNEIVRRNEVIETNEILNNLRKSVIEALNQTGNYDEQKDGMDMSILAFKWDEKNEIYEAQFSGANNPLYLVKSEKLKVKSEENLSLLPLSYCFEEIKGDSMPISIHNRMDDFTKQEFNLYKNDIVYLKTDGFEDAIGGAKEKKFLSKNLKQLLLNNANLPMNEQKIVLEKTLQTWIGFGEQIDDVTILGIKF